MLLKRIKKNTFYLELNANVERYSRDADMKEKVMEAILRVSENTDDAEGVQWVVENDRQARLCLIAWMYSPHIGSFS